LTTTRKRAPRALLILICFGVACLGSLEALAQSRKINIDELMADTQRSAPETDKMTLVWWLPEEYWRATLNQDPTVTAAETAELLEVLKPYNLFVVVDGKIGSLGGVKYRPEEEIRKSVRVIDKLGNSYEPITEDKIDADTKNFLSIMKPVLANILGPLGQNMQFYLFPAMNKEGKLIIQATAEGSFTFKLGTSDFKWKLPLGSLLATKFCPVDGEEVNGAWKFCPWHGDLLKVKP
jgi:hypothetical protein